MSLCSFLCLKILPYLLFTFSHLDNRKRERQKKSSSQDKSLAPKLILASRKSGVVTQRQEAPEGNRFILVITMVYIRLGNWPTLGFSAKPCLMLKYYSTVVAEVKTFIVVFFVLSFR